ncbi:MAG: 4Fe-4S dicluster domain-containing protein [Gammaproteobacteria bacterium]|nr:4Fe-4S dicluster domain-containing protein [Gammaproteobacteria bacterium]MBU1624224.1 4Fe-4S dicluster domain-containing protein [Gammaproteobacteria bacterium]MBU1981952.1 4Fe-4S dicluster domain-containing protein [Gammaproteobacteria bacterium]
MKLHLDWSSYETAGQGDAYAGIPATGGDFAKAVAVCISDKQCQRKPKGVMCPSFRATDDVAHSPGGRVQVLKAALNGELGENAFAGSELAAALELCVGCKGCKRECANQVDMAAIKIEYQAQRNEKQGVSLRERLIADLPQQLHHHTFMRSIIRWRNRAPWLAKLGERFLGISAKRKLPEPSSTPFVLSSEAYRSMNDFGAQSKADSKDVILFVDTFSNHFEPEIAQAAHEVLSAAGYRVTSLQPELFDEEPERALCCGRTYLSLGQVEQAKREARRMQLALRPALAAGTPIVGLEPSCILSLRDDHLKLGLGEEAVALSKRVYLFEEFIAREHDRKRLTLDLKPLPPGKTLVHGHCHQKAVGAMKSLRKVLRMIPEFDFEFIEASCCGMAGSFGLEAEHADISMQMAELDLLPALRAAPDAAILANGFSCRHQIHEGTQRNAQHVALLLRDALKESTTC